MSRIATYIPTGEQTIIINDIDDNYVSVFLEGSVKTVSKKDIQLEKAPCVSSLPDIKKAVFANMVEHPVSNLLYSYDTNHLIPEFYQYRPLIKMLKSPNNRLLIADEVGLGKTIESGMILKEFDKRQELEIVVVVVPPSLTMKWKNEMLMRFGETFEIKKVNDFKNFLVEYNQYYDSQVFNERIIISYNTLRDETITGLLQESLLHIDLLIMDEAHTFRNRETNTFLGAALLTGMAESIVFLSATPVQNSMSDLFNILSLLDEDNFLDEEYFKEVIRPNVLIHKVIAGLKNGDDVSKIKNYLQEKNLSGFRLNDYQHELFKRFLNETQLTREERVAYIKAFTEADNLSYIINRTKKKDVGKFIPREAVSHTIPGTPEEEAFYDSVIEFVKLLYKYRNPKIPSGFITIMPERMASSCMLASIESFKKMRQTKKLLTTDVEDLDSETIDQELEEVLLEKLDTLIATGEKIGEQDSKYRTFEKIIDDLMKKNIKKMIVFSFFKKTLDYLEERLQQKGIRVGKIHGDLSPEERYEAISHFKKDQFDVLLSSEVGSEGLDMQFCNVVINYDLPWNPMRIEQRIGRIDRIGQKAEKLLIFNLTIENTVEDKILSRLYGKLNIFEESIGELEPILGDITSRFDIEKMIDLSKEEIQRKIDLEAQALIRQKQEIAEQNSAMETMLNDDYVLDETYEEYIHQEKMEFIRQETCRIFLEYLKEHNIEYLSMKDGVYRLNREESKKLFHQLKNRMASKTEDPVQYKAQRKILSRLRRDDYFYFSFLKKEQDDYTVENITLSHPLIKMMLHRDERMKYGCIISDIVDEGYAVLYREDIEAHKKFSNLRLAIFSNNLQPIEKTIDFYSFLVKCNNAVCDETIIEELKSHKPMMDKYIADRLSKRAEEQKEETARLIDQKIAAIREHFAKKRAFVERMKEKSIDRDLIRMRQHQLQNLDELEKKKIEELERQKDVKESSALLAVFKIVGNDR